MRLLNTSTTESNKSNLMMSNTEVCFKKALPCLSSTLSILLKVVKVEMCGSGGQAFESTSHMPRNMVSGKPSTRIARQMDTSPPLDFYFIFTRTDVWEYVLQDRQEYGIM
jgi:hypothetical protein